MSIRKKLVLVITILGAILLSLVGCGTVKLASISIVDTDYKKVYVIGEELDSAHMQFLLAYSDETKAEASYAELKQDLVFINFSTAKENKDLKVTVRYKSVETNFNIMVVSQEDSAVKFDVNFEVNGGNDIPNQNLSIFSTVVEPQVPTKAGYAFDGWFKDRTLTNRWNFNTDKIVGETTLYAKWAFLYKITFKAPQSGAEDIIKLVKAGGELTDVPEVPKIDGKIGTWDRTTYKNITMDLIVTAEYKDVLFSVGFFYLDEVTGAENEFNTFKDLLYGTDLTQGEYYKKIQEYEESLIADSHKEHHHFVGWDHQFDNIKSNLRIFPKYETNTYTVTFNAVGGTETAPKEVRYGASVPEPTAPTRVGYDFDGWYTTAEYNTAYDFGIQISRNTELYAKWTQVHTLTFLHEDGSAYATRTVRHGESLQQADIPTVPGKAGHEGKWDRLVFTDVSVSGTISPIYKILSYTVRFRDGGTILQVDGKDSQLVKYNEAAKEPQQKPTKDGYTFVGWDKPTNHITENIDFIALFTANKYQITYVTNADGIAYPTTTRDYGTTIQDLPTPTRSGFDFDGWFTEEGFINSWTTQSVVNKDVVLHAKWTKLYVVIFNYIKMGATEATDNEAINVRNGERINMLIVPELPNRVGYNTEWQIDGESLELSTYIVTENITITAQYTPASYTVTFKFGGAVPDEIISGIPYNGKVSDPVTPERTPQYEGHTYLRWDKDPATTNIISDTVFNPIFDLNKYVVRYIVDFDPNNPEEPLADPRIVQSSTVSHGSNATLPAEKPQIQGYTFSGWDNDGIKIVAARDIKAKFIKESYDVLFMAEDNSTLQENRVFYKDTIAYNGTAPSKEGHTFVGWDYNNDGRYTKDEENMPITSVMIIRPIFAKNTYQVTFDSLAGGQVPSATVKYGDKLTKPSDPIYDNHIFLGWFTATDWVTKYDFNKTVVKNNFTIYAKWELHIIGSDSLKFTYDKKANGYSVTEVTNKSATHITVPNFYKDANTENLDGLPVIAIAAGVFSGMTSLISVELPSTLTVISANVFYGCTSLRTIKMVGSEGNYMPDNLTTIGDNAFANCVALQEIKFNKNTSQLTAIGKFAFSGAKTLKGFQFPTARKIVVGTSAFYDCDAITVVTFPDNVGDIEGSAFANCDLLRYVKFESETPPVLASTAFDSCSNSFRLYVANLANYQPSGSIAPGWTAYNSRVASLKNISQDGNFAYTKILTGENAGKVKILQYLGTSEDAVVGTQIRDNAGNLTDIAEIGDFAFDNTIISLSLVESVVISSNTLMAATSMQRLSVSIKDKSMLRIDTQYIKAAFDAISSLTQLNISAKLTLKEFFGNTPPPQSLVIVHILKDSDTILDKMFEDCSNLKEVGIYSNMATIGNKAFANCRSLTTIALLEGYSTLSSIGAEAFYNCSNLGLANTEGTIGLSLPNTVRTIGRNALEGTKLLTGLSATEDLVVVGNGILYKYFGTEEVVTLTANIKSINEYAFYQNKRVRSIVYDNDCLLTAIGAYAFDECDRLENIILPSTVTSIGTGAFRNASKLVKVVLLSGTPPTLGENVFGNTMGDIELYVLNSVVNSYKGNAKYSEVFGSRIIGSISYSFVDNWIVARIDEDNASILQYFGTEQTVTVPSTVRIGAKDCAVVSINNYAFVRQISTQGSGTPINHIQIPVSIQLSAKTFGGVTGLAELTILDSQNLNNANREYIYKLVNSNKGLSTLNMGGSVPLKTLLNDNLSPQHIIEVNVLSGETMLADNMFKDATYIKTINLPSTLHMDKIGYNAFKNSAWAAAVQSDFVTINTAGGDIIVEYKGQGSLVEIPTDSTLHAINRGVFRDNDTLEVVFIVGNITNIYEEAFANASSLTKLFMESATAPTIAATTFSGLAKGAELFIPQDSPNYNNGWGAFEDIVDVSYAKDGDYYYSQNGNEARLLLYCGSDKDVAIPTALPNGTLITGLGNNVFFKSVENITINANDYVAQNAFANLKSVKKVTVLHTDENIAMDGNILNAMLKQNTGLSKLLYSGDITLKQLLGGTEASLPPQTLAEVEILQGSTVLVDNLLSGCTGIAEIILPDTITTVGNNLFEDTIWFSRQKDFVIILDGLLYKFKGNNDTKPNIKQEIKVINSYAFATLKNGVWVGNQQISTIGFETGSQITEIRAHAFENCKLLVTINLPATIIKVDPTAFNGTKIVADSNGLLVAAGATTSTVIKYSGSAATVNIPASVTTIVADAFSGNTTLEKVIFANGSKLSVIREGAFKDCTMLIKVGTAANNDALPSGLTEIGKNAFYNTQWIEVAPPYVVVGGTLLLYTGDATSITISKTDNISAISYTAFASVEQKITEVIIAADVEEILPGYAIKGAFDTIDTIKVPQQKLSLYQSAWSIYKDKIVGY